jgi:S-adenosylhomocysteine hydrolase
LFHALFAAGLDPADLSVIGKCYSTNPEVMREMIREGIDVDPASLAFEAGEPFDRTFSRAVRRFVQRSVARRDLGSYRRILVLDDGGELLRAVHDMLGGQGLEIAGIEQTTSGYDKLKDLDLVFPVVNVARSGVKLEIEAPMIADNVVERTVEVLQSLETRPREVLIIGNGAIGCQLYEVLRNSYHVVRFDVDQARSDLPESRFEEALGRADVVIGCTGRTVLRGRECRLLKKGAVLVSASSSDREFDAVGMRRRAGPISDCHADVEVDGICLANCGFPVNFRGERDTIAPELIQVTRALLAAGVLQAATMPEGCEAGFVDLDHEIHGRLRGAWLSRALTSEVRRVAS